MANYKRVSVDSLYVDDRYQRPLDSGRVKRMASKFDEALLGTLEVSQRNGTGSYAVFDGQHRLEAAKLAGIKMLPCLIHKGLAPEEEADLFVNFQRQRKTITPLERFRARLFMGDETAVEISAVADECGYKIGSTSDAGRARTLAAVGAVESVHQRGNLRETLTLLSDLWGGDERSTDGGLIRGLSVFQAAYSHRLDEQAMGRLRAVAPAVILRRAVGTLRGGSTERLIAAELRKTAGLGGRMRKAQEAGS